MFGKLRHIYRRGALDKSAHSESAGALRRSARGKMRVHLQISATASLETRHVLSGEFHSEGVRGIDVSDLPFTFRTEYRSVCGTILSHTRIVTSRKFGKAKKMSALVTLGTRRVKR